MTAQVTNEIFGHADAQMKRVSHQDIAARLGLNQSTVSRALRDSPKIPPETRRRIQAAASKMGYRPNPLLSELAASRWQMAKAATGSVIAYIDGNSSGESFGGSTLIPSLREQASLLGYQLQTFHRREFGDSSKLQKVLRNRGITDVILGPVYEDSLRVELDWSKHICVQLLPGRSGLPLHSVTKDYFNAVILAWQKAVGHGYRRIGAVMLEHPIQVMDDVMRASAVYACQRHLFADLPRLPAFPYVPGVDGTTGGAHARAFVQWVEAHQPDVIIAFTEFHYYVFRTEFGYAPPFISLHVSDADKTSGIPEDAARCGKEAVNLLHFCRRTYQWGVPQRRIDHVIEPTWHEGKTLPQKLPL